MSGWRINLRIFIEGKIPQITLKELQSSLQISGNLLRFAICSVLIWGLTDMSSSLPYASFSPSSIKVLSKFVTKANYTKKWPLTALDRGFPVIVWDTVFSSNTTPSASSKLLLFMSLPMLSKKLIKRWSTPRIHLMTMDFSLIISVAFIHDGW